MCADAVLSEPWRGRRRSASGGDGALDADRAADHDERARRKALASKIAGCVAAHWRAFGAAFEGPAKEAKTLFDLGRVEDDSDDDEPAAAVVVAAVAGGRRPSLSDAARRCLLATAAVLHAQPASAPSSSSSSSPRNRPTNDDSLPSAPLSPLSATLLQAIEIILCEAQNDICYTAIASLERAMREAEASKQPLVKLPI